MSYFKKIPQFLASFFESSVTCGFQLKSIVNENAKILDTIHLIDGFPSKFNLNKFIYFLRW